MKWIYEDIIPEGTVIIAPLYANMLKDLIANLFKLLIGTTLWAWSTQAMVGGTTNMTMNLSAGKQKKAMNLRILFVVNTIDRKFDSVPITDFFL